MEERDNEKREYVKAIPLEKISDFPDHPFKVRMDEKMMEQLERGQLTPSQQLIYRQILEW